jgi:hypothetical protein
MISHFSSPSVPEPPAAERTADRDGCEDLQFVMRTLMQQSASTVGPRGYLFPPFDQLFDLSCRRMDCSSATAMSVVLLSR